MMRSSGKSRLRLMMIGISRGIATLLALIALSSPVWAADAPLRLTTGMREPWTTPEQDGFTDLLIAALSQRLGLPVTLSVNPAAARAISLANDGVDDGLAARVAGLEKDYPNLIRVPEPIFVNDFVACTNAPQPSIKTWADLSPHSVAYIIGWQIFERNLPALREVTTTRDSRQLVQLLQNRRADVILHERWQALWQAHQLGHTVTVQEPPLAQVPMYLYLHKNHAALIPAISAELAAMKADGTHNRLQEKAFSRILPGG
ncbi:MAG: hypothetical protein BGO92_09605 [Magnetospirillum sp. 64-120]|nr:MAG: hypothetical protein BGO92_09605 [Magnetospirillum sp. 64-120]